MVLVTSRYYPNTVISNLTALVIHKLSDESLDRIDVDIDRSQTLRNRLLKVHRVSGSRKIGVSKMKFMGELIRVYDLERTLCEAYRMDPSGDLFFKAVKRYLKRYKPDFNKIDKYDQKLKTKVLTHLRQELTVA